MSAQMMLLLLFLSQLFRGEAYNINDRHIEIYKCERPIGNIEWRATGGFTFVNRLHHEIYTRNSYTGGGTLVTFAPTGLKVTHYVTADSANKLCTFIYQGRSSLNDWLNLEQHLESYQKSYNLFSNNCQHFAAKSLAVLDPQ